MNAEIIKKEFENRKLKQQCKSLSNMNSILKRQLDVANEHIDARVEKRVKIEIEKLEKENKRLASAVAIAEDAKLRLKASELKLKTKLSEKTNEAKQLEEEIIKLRREIERLKVLQNLDGTNSGLPTSKTPINKTKVIPNSRKNTGEKIGRKQGHKKDKLARIDDDKIHEHIKHELNECPNCRKEELIPTGKIISKDVKDYKIIVNNTRHNYIEYKCSCCGKTVHEIIPNHLKEECQYGSNLKSLVLTLSNIGNVPYNKQRRIISGLSIGEIEPCEGYLAKLQQQSSKKLDSFIEELRQEIIKSTLVYWDDTVVQINKKQSCMRYYGTDDLCLFIAHEKKDKKGLDEDKILSLLSANQIVEHDHNKVNYNQDYSFINAECCQHLLRDLKKVKDNLPSRTWCVELIELFQKYNHKRKELIAQNIDSFSPTEVNDFILQIDQILLKGIEENKNDLKAYYSKKEATLIYRIIEYRDNYIYWVLDFDIPFTNNLSERNLRGIKSKMKVSGQFQNIERANDYAKVRSYIETCRRYGVNDYVCLTRLVEDKPYTLSELQALKNK